MEWTKVDGGPQRVNHAGLAIGKKIYSFGGYCGGMNFSKITNIDIFILDTRSLRWTPCYCQNSLDQPFQRYGHTVVSYKEKIYLWGGRNDHTACNRLYCFDPKTRLWTAPETKSAPPARDGHSACVIGDYMYIFSGHVEVMEQLGDDIHALDLKTLRWSKIIAKGPAPLPRDFHTACGLNGKMYVWGGRSMPVLSPLPESHIYDTQLHAFTPATRTWEIVHDKGTVPSGRRSHSMVSYKNKLFVFGGFNGQLQLHYNDLHQLDMDKFLWTQHSVKGILPLPRRRHVACIVGSTMYIMGGTSPSNVDQNTEENPDDEDELTENQLSDNRDLHFVDLEFSLRSMCIKKTLFYSLNQSSLPVDIQRDIAYMSTPNLDL